MSSWSRIVALSARDRWLLGESLVLLLLNKLALRLVRLKNWQAVLARLSPLDAAEGCDAAAALDRARRTARLVSIAASRGLVRGNCLQQSLTLWVLLRRQKLTCEIKFGARKDSGRFNAHAWVELGGVAMDERRVAQRNFTPFERTTLRTAARRR